MCLTKLYTPLLLHKITPFGEQFKDTFCIDIRIMLSLNNQNKPLIVIQSLTLANIQNVSFEQAISTHMFILGAGCSHIMDGAKNPWTLLKSPFADLAIRKLNGDANFWNVLHVPCRGVRIAVGSCECRSLIPFDLTGKFAVIVDNGDCWKIWSASENYFP